MHRTLDEIPERFQLPAPDRGVWTQEHLRERAKRPTLVMGGRKAGKSRVVYFSPNLELILFRRGRVGDALLLVCVCVEGVSVQGWK